MESRRDIRNLMNTGRLRDIRNIEDMDTEDIRSIEDKRFIRDENER
jgi:hypothetical protein